MMAVLRGRQALVEHHAIDSVAHTAMLVPVNAWKVLLTPGIEYQERPEDLPVIVPSVEMFTHEARDGLRIEKTGLRHPFWRQTFLHDASQRTAQPQTDRHTKPLLPARKNLPRK